MGLINIDYNIFAEDLLPVELHDIYMVEWMMTLLKPLMYQYSVTNNYYESIIFDITHKGEVIVLEHYLNGIFNLPNDGFGEIYITDGEWYNEVYLFIDGSDRETSLNNFGEYSNDGQIYTVQDSETFNELYTYSDDEYNIDQIDFIIFVDATWTDIDRENKIKAITERYKKVGKTYKIRTY